MLSCLILALVKLAKTKGAPTNSNPNPIISSHLEIGEKRETCDRNQNQRRHFLTHSTPLPIPPTYYNLSLFSASSLNSLKKKKKNQFDLSLNGCGRFW